MAKAHYRFAVIIVSYNVAADAIKAAESVIATTSENESYIIQIADNGSKNDWEILKEYKHPRVRVTGWTGNIGYARGYNKAIQVLEEECDFDYFVLMNADIVVNSNGLIERLLSSLESEDETVVGIQPLIRHMDRTGDACEQNQVRRLHSYWDEVILNLVIPKRLFQKRVRELYYASEKPFRQKLYFEVPSGCFFIIKADVFRKIGYFDNRTYLYHEEFIMAHRIRERGERFVLLPEGGVDHYHGKATGNRNKGMNPAGHKALTDSISLYLVDYVNAPRVAVKLLAFMMQLEYTIKRAIKYYK